MPERSWPRGERRRARKTTSAGRRAAGQCPLTACSVLTSVCTGSGLLASAGLLDGCQATSNKRASSWLATRDREWHGFRRRVGRGTAIGERPPASPPGSTWPLPSWSNSTAPTWRQRLRTASSTSGTATRAGIHSPRITASPQRDRCRPSLPATPIQGAPPVSDGRHPGTAERRAFHRSGRVGDVTSGRRSLREGRRTIRRDRRTWLATRRRCCAAPHRSPVLQCPWP